MSAWRRIAKRCRAAPFSLSADCPPEVIVRLKAVILKAIRTGASYRQVSACSGAAVTPSTLRGLKGAIFGDVAATSPACDGHPEASSGPRPFLEVAPESNLGWDNRHRKTALTSSPEPNSNLAWDNPNARTACRQPRRSAPTTPSIVSFFKATWSMLAEIAFRHFAQLKTVPTQECVPARTGTSSSVSDEIGHSQCGHSAIDAVSNEGRGVETVNGVAESGQSGSGRQA